jgi:6,7-dimethyl-8-ribityllumazine synthase
VDLAGTANGSSCRFAIVVSKFNQEITDGLLRGARAALTSAGVAEGDVTTAWVPGAFELPVIALKLAQSKRFDAVIALGCLIKGETMHFEYIAETCAHGLMHASTTTGVPVLFGVLTTTTEEQARERAAEGDANKGREVAAAAIEMATLLRRLWQAAL